MIVITIINQKGGVGKTTTAVNLATGLARFNRPVVLMDCDPQGSAGKQLGLEESEAFYNAVVKDKAVESAVSMSDQGYETLVVIPGGSKTTFAEMLISQGGLDVETAIRNAIKPFDHDKTIVIIDTSPTISAIQTSAMYAADYVIAPFIPESLSEVGIRQLIENAEELNSAGNDISLLGMLPMKVDFRYNEHKNTLKRLRDEFGDYVLSPVRQLSAYLKAAEDKKPVWSLGPSSPAYQDFDKVLMEVKARV